MATALSTKPSTGPHMKHPPLSAVQSAMNGAKSSNSSASSGPASKRPPTGVTPSSGPSSSPSSATNRAPVRRSSQRPGEIQTRPSRPTKIGDGGGTPGSRPLEPYVKTAEYILKRHAKKPPSLIIHLHPTHFRFDQQDGSFSYNSPMKMILQNIKQQTIPHEIFDDLLASGIPFYDNCLIVQVHDHRNEIALKDPSSKDSKKENQPFSMHKYSKFLVPSPYSTQPNPEGPDRGNAASHLNSERSETTDTNSQDSLKTDARKSRCFTTVLFPTPSSLGEDVISFAEWADDIQYKRSKRVGQKSGAPSTPTGPAPAKRQKLLSDITKLHQVEAKLIYALAPQLYLEPAENMEQVQELLQKLQDPRFTEEPPMPKSRKRTIAELAADEAQAAAAQRFMLSMDERHQSSAANAGAADAETGVSTFEPRFERFKAIEEIRRQHEDKQREEAEAKIHVQMEKERQMRERQAAELERQKQAAALHLRQQQARAQQSQVMHAAQSSHSHPQPTNMVVNGQQFHNNSGHQGSPAMRTMTPHSAASPVNTQAMAVSRSTQGSVPMAVVPSRQGSGSPPRPGSALQHTHPLGMVPAQQPPSRNGTPHITAGATRMQTSTPILHNSAGTPRISQASPAMANVTSASMPGHAIMGTPQMGGRPVNQQHRAAVQMQTQNTIRQNAFLQMARGQGSPANVQLAGQPVQPQIAVGRPQQQQAQMWQNNSSQENAFRQQGQPLHNVQMTNGQHPQASMGIGGQPGFNMQMQQTGQQTASARATQPSQVNIWLSRAAATFFQALKAQAMSSGQTMTQELENTLRIQSITKAREAVKTRLEHAQQLKMLQQQQHQQQQHNTSNSNAMMNNGGGSGMMGMNGMG